MNKLTPLQTHVLRMLSDVGEADAPELARGLRVKGSHLGGVLASLHHRGLIEHYVSQSSPTGMVWRMTGAAGVALAAAGHGHQYETPVALALRALQRFVALEQPAPKHRALISDAQTQLGIALGLRCTGEAGNHGDGATCPVHEWLVDADHDALEASRELPSP